LDGSVDGLEDGVLPTGTHRQRATGKIWSSIVGTGGSVPERLIDNDELARRTGISAAAIQRRTGIEERRWAADQEATSDLALRASMLALNRAHLRPESLDAIIVSTTSPDTPLPSCACHLQRSLGASRAFAFDLAASCSGFLYALSVGDQLIRMGNARRILLVAAEVKSRCLNFSEGEAAILFGDGAAAAVLAPATGRHGLCSVTLGADGSLADLIGIRAGGSRLPSSGKTVAEGLHGITMKGPRLFRVAVRRLESAVLETLRMHDLNPDDVHWFFFHQANARLLQKVLARLGIPQWKTASLIERYGNTSSSSLPLTLDAAIQDGRLKSGDLILLAAIGAGLTWGTALIKW
jgi:3-oxoacyl-[acyl-carrier-protein] synthase III